MISVEPRGVGEAHLGEKIGQALRHEPGRGDKTGRAPAERIKKRAAPFQPQPGGFARQVEKFGFAVGVETRPEKGGEIFRRRFPAVVKVAVQDDFVALRLPAGNGVAEALVLQHRAAVMKFRHDEDAAARDAVAGQKRDLLRNLRRASRDGRRAARR